LSRQADVAAASAEAAEAATAKRAEAHDALAAELDLSRDDLQRARVRLATRSASRLTWSRVSLGHASHLVRRFRWQDDAARAKAAVKAAERAQAAAAASNSETRAEVAK